jgi:hypothetical protein
MLMVIHVPPNNGGCATSATCTRTAPGTNRCGCNMGYMGNGMTRTPSTHGIWLAAKTWPCSDGPEM